VKKECSSFVRDVTEGRTGLQGKESCFPGKNLTVFYKEKKGLYCKVGRGGERQKIATQEGESTLLNCSFEPKGKTFFSSKTLWGMRREARIRKKKGLTHEPGVKGGQRGGGVLEGKTGGGQVWVDEHERGLDQADKGSGGKRGIFGGGGGEG